MAKLRNKKSDGSLIFTWVIILLISLATVIVVMSHINTEREYRENHSTFIMNEEVAAALSDTLNIPAGLITHEDLAKIKGAFVMLDMPVSFDGGNTQTTLSTVEFQLEGYREADEAYYAEGVTDEERKNLVDPSTLAGFAYLSDASNLDDLKLLTGLESFNALNYSETVNTDYDFVQFASENFTELSELVVFGFDTTDLGPVKSLTKLETLAFDGETITDISAIADLTALKDLSINGTAVSDISVLSSLTNLENIDLSYNKITDISVLSNLSNDKITSIALTGNEIKDYSPVSHIDEDKITRDKTEEEKAAEESEESEQTEASEGAE